MDISRIHQIELTTMCNLRCRYCPHGKMQRKKEHISLDTFLRALEWVKYFDLQGTQPELSLTGIGEPLMHPMLEELLVCLRGVYKGAVLLSTNGILMTEEMGAMLAHYGVWVYVSTHRPEKAGPAINICRRRGIFAGSNTAFADSALDWAGQVDWEVSAPQMDCKYLGDGWGVVLVDGRITTCCMDAEGAGLIGNVEEVPYSIGMHPYSLCKSCHMDIKEA